MSNVRRIASLILAAMGRGVFSNSVQLFQTFRTNFGYFTDCSKCSSYLNSQKTKFAINVTLLCNKNTQQSVGFFMPSIRCLSYPPRGE